MKRHNRFRFSLRTLLLVVTACAVTTAAASGAFGNNIQLITLSCAAATLFCAAATLSLMVVTALLCLVAALLSYSILLTMFPFRRQNLPRAFLTTQALS